MDSSATACPGDLLYAYIGSNVNAGEARDEVNYRITGGATPTPTPAPPAAPSNLAGVAVTSTRIDLTWNDNSNNEDNFVVERKKSKGTYAPIATLPAGTTAFSDTTVARNTTYNYRVKAVNGGGSSAYSHEITVKMPR